MNLGYSVDRAWRGRGGKVEPMKRKIPSRKFSKSSKSIASRPMAKRMEREPSVVQEVDSSGPPIQEGTREQRLDALKERLKDKLKSFPGVD